MNLEIFSAGVASLDDQAADPSLVPVFGAAETPGPPLDCGDILPGLRRLWDFKQRSFTEVEHILDPRKRPVWWRSAGLSDESEGEGGTEGTEERAEREGTAESRGQGVLAQVEQ
eukprot:2902727-Rhodomonas_salina.1